MPHLFREARDLADDVRRVFEELVLSRIDDRRGREIPVPIKSLDPVS